MTEPGRYRRQLLVNTASTVGGALWAMVLAIVSLPFLLSGLGTEAFGAWALIQTFSAFTGWLSLADLGVGVATVRRVSDRAAVDDSPAVQTAIGTSVAVYLVLGATAGAVLASVGPRVLPSLFRIPGDLVPDVRFALAVFGIQVLAELVSAGLYASIEGLQRVDLARMVDALRRTMVALATAVTAMAGGGLRGVAVTSAVGTVVATVVGFLVLRRRLPAGLGRPSATEARALGRYATTVGMLRSTGVLHRTMDRVIVGAVLGPAAVTLVEIATQIQNGAMALLSAASHVAISSSSWVRARGDENPLRELVLSGTKYSLLLTTPVIVYPLVVALPLVLAWVGPEYRESAGLVALALVYLAVQAPLAVGSNMLQGVGRASAVLRAAAAALVVNLAASLVLVHSVGIAGPFLATLLSCVVLVPPLLRAVLREVGVSPGTFLRSAVLPAVGPSLALAAASAVPLTFGWAPWPTVLAAAALGLPVYVALAARWSIGAGERTELRRVLGRLVARGEG